MIKKISGILLILLIFILIGAVQASDDFNETLTSDIDEAVIEIPAEAEISKPDDNAMLSEIQVENKTFKDIQNAIDASKPNDTIELEGVYTRNGSKIRIPFHELTFVGKNGGATLDARNLSEIIYSNAPRVTFKNINFINGNTVGNLELYRSVIHAEQELVLENCSMTNNHITQNFLSRLIFSRSSVNLTKSIFSNNDYYNDLMNVGDCCIDNCTFENNHIYSEYQRRLLLSGSLVITNSRFNDINSLASSGNCTAVNSIFNKVCLSVNGKENKIINCSFTNSKQAIDIIISGNGQINFNITNSSFENISENLIVTTAFSDYEKTINLNITGSTFENFKKYYLKSNLKIMNSTFKGGSVEASGNISTFMATTFIAAPLYLHTNNTYINDCCFINNTKAAISVSEGYNYLEIGNSKFINNSNSNYGGAIDEFGHKRMIVKNCEFINNSASGGGAIFAYDVKNITIENCSFIKNHNPILFWKIPYENIKFEKCSFKDNVASHNKDIVGYYKVSVKQTGSYDGETSFNVKVIDAYTNKLVPFECLKNVKFSLYQILEFDEETGFYWSIGNEFSPAKASDGSLIFKVKDVYKSDMGVDYKIVTSKFNSYFTFTDGEFSSDFYFGNKTIKKPHMNIVPTKLSITARTSENVLVLFKDLNNKAYMFNAKYTIKLYKGDKVVFTKSGTDSDISLYGHNFNAGTYKMVITASNEAFSSTSITKTFKVEKVKTKVVAPKITAKYKKTKYFKITVKQLTKEPLNPKVKVKVKIGKKTYNLKTDSKGVIKFNTKSLKVGKYAVKITSGDSNVSINGKSAIIIKR